MEFLVDPHGRHVFIEMNPRIQVEHTVTEEVTDVDLVQSQMRIASGETLEGIGLRQSEIRVRGAALQCRITTEDPANGFRPDTGKITAYRSPGGAGIRLDGGTTFSGAEVSAHFDSLLTKLTCRGRDFPAAVARARRAVAEFRIRGVATNIPFLQGVLDDPDFIAGGVTTSFIETHPELLTARASADRGTKLLTYLADVTVNQPYGEPRASLEPATKLPDLGAAADAPPPAGSAEPVARASVLRLSPLRCGPSSSVRVTDTTFRDAHQSLLATRVRTRDLAAVAGHVARLTPQLWSVEAWGGATYDVALRFLAEDPWERLATLREAMPNLCLQMLLRGRNTVGYTPYPTQVTDAFVAEAASTGSTSSGSSTRSTTSSRCGRRSRPSGPPAPPSPRSPSATPATCPTRGSGSTRWTTTSAWPSGSSARAPTCWPSRTWPACCAHPPRARWSRPCASGSTCRSTCTPTTRPAGSWRPCWPPSTPGSTRSTRRARRCRARPASRR